MATIATPSATSTVPVAPSDSAASNEDGAESGQGVGNNGEDGAESGEGEGVGVEAITTILRFQNKLQQHKEVTRLQSYIQLPT